MLDANCDSRGIPLLEENLQKLDHSMSAVDIHLLGPFEVANRDRALPLGGRRQRAVLALLAIHAGEVLSTHRIADDIWAGDPPPSAVQTVHTYISRLRSVLRASCVDPSVNEIITSCESGYVLRAQQDWIDAIRFEQAVAEASTAFGTHRLELATERIQKALSIWRGVALADFVYEPFAAGESQRLGERKLEAIELRIDIDLSLGRHAPNVAALEGLTAEHPVREHFWAQLMTALYRCGRQADALSAYGKVRRTLIEELGLEPGPELRRLEHMVLEQSDELTWRPPRGEPSVLSSKRTPKTRSVQVTPTEHDKTRRISSRSLVAPRRCHAEPGWGAS
jgi:DNA-binding SARP family transcriptional activator